MRSWGFLFDRGCAGGYRLEASHSPILNGCIDKPVGPHQASFRPSVPTRWACKSFDDCGKNRQGLDLCRWCMFPNEAETFIMTECNTLAWKA